MNTIFADYSGNFKDKRSRIVSYASAIVIDSSINQLENEYKRLNTKVKNIVPGVVGDIEFHTSDIMNGSGIWRNISKDVRLSILERLRAIIFELRIPFIILLIDKDESGKQSTIEYSKTIRSISPFIIGEETEKVEKKLQDKMPNLDLNQLKREPLTDLIALFLGLNVGLINNNKLMGNTILVADHQFVRQIDLWEAIFSLLSLYWDSAKEKGLFFNWPKDNQPQWTISNTIIEMDSTLSFGIQLADYIAYTSRYLLDKTGKHNKELALVNKLAKLTDGIYASTGNYT